MILRHEPAHRAIVGEGNMTWREGLPKKPRKYRHKHQQHPYRILRTSVPHWEIRFQLHRAASSQSSWLTQLIGVQTNSYRTLLMNTIGPRTICNRFLLLTPIG